MAQPAKQKFTVSKEQPQPHNAFEFTEREKLFERVSEARFKELLEDERTAIHRVELSANNYGEFLFVTLSQPEAVSQPVGERKSVVTMFGLGYHEYRERWLTEEWFWYEAFSHSELLEQTMTKEEVEEILRERREEISPYLADRVQSRRGKLFEMLADLTDDDGAIAEMEDLGDDLADWLADGLD